MRHTFYSVTLGLVLLVLTAGAEAQDGGVPKLSEAREAAAVAFAKKHAPELLEMLLPLKNAEPGEYQANMRGIFETSEHLQELKEEDPEMFVLALNGWRMETRVHVLAAKLIYGQGDPDKLESELAKVCGSLVKIQIEHTDLAIRRTEAELERLKAEREEMDKDKEATANKHLSALLAHIKKQKAAGGGSDASTGLAQEVQTPGKLPPELKKKLLFLKELLTRRQRQGRDLSALRDRIDTLNETLRDRDFERAAELAEEMLELLLENGKKESEGRKLSPRRY